MLLFLSDLHLTDSVERSTLDLTRLTEQLDLLLRRAVQRLGVEQVKLVLLGDAFELLKSRAWLDRGLRPWDLPTESHTQLVADVFAAVAKANDAFLTDLRGLTDRYPLNLDYLPGNHDLYLNGPMGEAARRRLQEILPLSQAHGARFGEVFLDANCGVLAKHGHEWDRANRYGKGTAAIGDAVVLEVLLQLPRLVAEALGWAEGDPRLTFLHEIDNVRPQHPRALAHWILAGLDGVGEIAAGGRRSLEDSFQQIARSLIGLTARVPFESTRELRWWKRFLLRTGRAFLRQPGLLRVAVHLPWGADRPSTYRSDALRDLEDAFSFGGEFRYVLCGHTHIHELVALDVLRGGPPPLYINTGTWRRTHRLAEVSSRRRARTFSTWQDECLVSIYSPEERKRGAPPYEVHRFTCGQAG